MTGMFSVVALVLVGISLFGVLAQDVSARRRELGSRLALGAQPSTLRWSVLRRALTVSIVGICGGAALASIGWRLAEAVVGPLEVPHVAVLAFDVGVVLAVSAAAAWIPAGRAARVDPAVTLRAQ
jgi:ABC-type antimicrobial peptide transport system permease subunit